MGETDDNYKIIYVVYPLQVCVDFVMHPMTLALPQRRCYHYAEQGCMPVFGGCRP